MQVKIDPGNGGAEVRENVGDPVELKNADGSPVLDDRGAPALHQQARSWNLRADQVEKHVEMFRALGASAGDLSAARDAANEAMKQRGS